MRFFLALLVEMASEKTLVEIEGLPKQEAYSVEQRKRFIYYFLFSSCKDREKYFFIYSPKSRFLLIL